MTHILSDLPDTDIQALVDQQLSWEEEKVVRAHLDAVPVSKARYLQLLQQKKQLQRWWEHTRRQQH